jgi:hypothetical protein
MPSRLVPLFAAAITLTAAAPARAQTFGTFQFADPSGQPQTSASIPGVGGTTDLRVYLLETDGLNALRTVGLFSADVRVRFDSPGGVAAVLSVADITRNPQFDQQLGTGVTATAAVLNEQDLTDPNGVRSPADDPTRIYLGTFRFTGQSLGTVTLTADSPVTTGGTLLNNGTDISNRIDAGTLTLTVTPVPEPASWVLGGLTAVGLAALSRLRATPRRVAGEVSAVTPREGGADTAGSVGAPEG